MPIVGHMAIIPGTCKTCGHYGYLFASQLCMTCEDKRLVGLACDPYASDDDREMLASFRDYVENTLR